MCAILTATLMSLRPDIERFLNQAVSVRHMPDAFNPLNKSIPFFMIHVTASFALSLWITIRQQYLLFIPLVTGPIMCLVGWYLTEDFADPNWFHLFALTTIGMFVSCLVTSVLSTMVKPNGPK